MTKRTPTAGDSCIDSFQNQSDYKKMKINHLNSAIMKSGFILLPRFLTTLEKLDVFYNLECPILFEGPIGCGKSTLIEIFHESCGENSHGSPLILNMGEQSDAKTLFGAFVTDPERPGHFCWKSGVVLEALTSGRWLIVEDLDLATAEIIAVLKGILECKNEFLVPSMGRTVSIHPSFRLLATRRSDAHLNQSVSAFDRLGKDLWQIIRLTAFSADEYLAIISGRYPTLKSLASITLQLFDLVSSSESSSSLFKFCSRLDCLLTVSAEDYLSEELRQALLLEAIDCFASSWNCRERRRELALQMSIILSIPETFVDNIFENRPEIHVSADRSSLSVGRVQFDCATFDAPRFRSLNGTGNIALTTLSSQTLEKLSVALKLNEPVLLVGETGTGKTTSVQYLSQLLQHRPNLRVLNMSQQSEASDLLGGFRPFSAQSLARPLLEDYLNVFGKAFSKSKNGEYIAAIQDAYDRQNWKRFIKLIKQTIETIRAKNVDSLIVHLDRLQKTLVRFETQISYAANNLLFIFVEGTLVEALTHGYWLLLDEINLASSETLNILSGLLRSSESSVILTERGDSEPLKRHPNFRLFACMNPATDVAKRDLPPAIKSRFTQIFVDETDIRREDLRQVIDHLLGPGRDGTLKERLTTLYYKLKELIKSFELVDGNGRKPLLNLRTLTRPIKFARNSESLYGIERALYEGWCLSFTTMLDEQSSIITRHILQEHLMPNESISSLKALRPVPSALPTSNYIIVDGYVLTIGPEFDIEKSAEIAESKFILTASVHKNVSMLARAVMARNYPILLEGPTSTGKTSVIEYLATRTGHNFVRINNHEHTDIQEYLGSYVSDPNSGKLEFREGVLVQSLRRGDWLVLDELNLAPSDILEALNRLLDDNRELFIPETGETVKPHPHFQLFATQNPAGTAYGGRKMLSRAFRSRFLELQFNDLPLEEIEQILSSRCRIAPSFAKRIAQTYRVLQERRSSSGTNIFAGKNALITLRDCFRWAERHAGSTQELAEDGYMVLAERCRQPEECDFIKTTLEKICKAKLDLNLIYDLPKLCLARGWEAIELDSILASAKDLGIVWTKPISRLFTLVFLCLRFKEPVLLVGETGCGKTTVCQLAAKLLALQLKTVNCHANSESSDFLGSYRPIRLQEPTGSDAPRRLFQWQDGPLVEAMQAGDIFLLDEISLADDSVLERLNSVLEPSRYLLLAECSEGSESRIVKSKDSFSILATMNPGGDFGKKELSPALRNRFTEVWVPSIGDEEDLRLIVQSTVGNEKFFVDVIVNFWYWWQNLMNSHSHNVSLLSSSKRAAASLRDLLGWLKFATLPEIKKCLSSFEARLLHGAIMVFTDRLGSENAELRDMILQHLSSQLNISLAELSSDFTVNLDSPDSLSFGPFKLERNSKSTFSQNCSFAFNAPTTKSSALRVVRALQIGKAVLLEGSPGVGKTTLIGALASATGNQLTRINLSDQTDLVDLFGSDLPVDGAPAGTFRWADGPFLQALKRGDWILLDELNLASQSVLEGLNACLDHRGKVYIPELGLEFECSLSTRIFAAQNPADQGGGRKGLPKSFLNRFTVVWFDEIQLEDYRVILNSNYHAIGAENIEKMISFNRALHEHVVVTRAFGTSGSPWEFNLRDLSRWAQLCLQYPNSPVAVFIRPLYSSRFRNEDDRKQVGLLVERIFGHDEYKTCFSRLPKFNVYDETFEFGEFTLPLKSVSQDRIIMLRDQIEGFESTLFSLNMGWLSIITGPESSGKTFLIESLASLHGKNVKKFFISPDTDTLELLGSFEQMDPHRRWAFLIEEIITELGDSFAKYSVLNDLAISELLSILPKDSNFVGKALAFQKINEIADGRFEWVDGPLVRALILGHWIVLENVNLANPAVLDRLNSLFEPNGSLVLSEQGCSSVNSTVRVIRPAPGFRVFMTVDPKFGEVSRAMRNRGIEISIFPTLNAKFIDNSSVIKSEFKSRNLGHESSRMTELLADSNIFDLSRRVIGRVARMTALYPALSNEFIAESFNLSGRSRSDLTAVEAFWSSKINVLPLLLSTTKNYPLQIQKVLLSEIQNVASVESIALIILFATLWSSSSDFVTRNSILLEMFNIQLSKDCHSDKEIISSLLKCFMNLSAVDESLIEALDFKSELIFGYLLWILNQSNVDPTFSKYSKTLATLGCGSSLEVWKSIWSRFGFKDASSVVLYSRTIRLLQSHGIVSHNVDIQSNLQNALETVLSTSSSSEVIFQVENFVACLENSSHLSLETCFTKLMFNPLVRIYLHNQATRVISRSVSIPRSSLAIEWASQLWSLSDKPEHFLAGNDGLGSLLEAVDLSWSTRKIKDEAELIHVLGRILKFVCSHGIKSKKEERIHIIRNLFPIEFVASQSLADSLLLSGLNQLKSNFFGFDPVQDYFQPATSALSTLVHYQSAQNQWTRLYSTALTGRVEDLTDDEEITKHKTEKASLENFLLARPESKELFSDLQQLIFKSLPPLISQIEEGCVEVDSNQFEIIQNSLLALRTIFVSKFVAYRDLVAPFIIAIDGIKLGLHLKQIESEDSLASNSALASILPLPFNNIDLLKLLQKQNELVPSLVALQLTPLSASIESTRPLLCSVLGRLVENVHEALRGEEARNQKDDSLFVFKGSNNDDDALDTEFEAELFTKPQKLNDEDEDDVNNEMEAVPSLPERKSVDFKSVALDLLSICTSISSNTRKSSQFSPTISWIFSFLTKNISLSSCSDAQVYRMLVFRLSETLSQRTEASGNANRKSFFDFYRDPCPENKLSDATKVLDRLQNRVSELMKEYPDHDLLQIISKRIERFCSLPVSSTSTIEALLTLEQLYQKAFDWEKYSASKTTALGDELSAILALIVTWRRFELESWRGLVDSILRKSEDEAAKEWLVLGRVALSAIDSDGAASVVELIDTFMLAAPIGQFSKRLEILDVCCNLANFNCSSAASSLVAATFKACNEYYRSTLAHRVQEYMRLCREPIDRDLSAFLMTIYWKDVNYWAVKQVSEKSHRHLAKMLRRWKDAVGMPLSALLSQLNIKPQLQISSIDSEPSKKNQSDKQASTPRKKHQLSEPISTKVLRRLEAVNERFSPLNGQVLSDFGSVVIEILNELKDSDVQSKQKAFVDLIRELKVLGVRINKNPAEELFSIKLILCKYAKETRSLKISDAKSIQYTIKTLEKWNVLNKAVCHQDITFRQAEIIRNSIAFLLDYLIGGSKRILTDQAVQLKDELTSALDGLRYRQSLAANCAYLDSPSSSTFIEKLNNFRAQVDFIRVLFDSHKSHLKEFSWNLHAELLKLLESTFSEIHSLFKPVRELNQHFVIIDKNSISRISTLLSSCSEYLSKFDFTTPESLQLTDVTSNLSPLVSRLCDEWKRLTENPASVPQLAPSQKDDLLNKLLLNVQYFESSIPSVASETLDQYALYPDYLRKHEESVTLLVNRISLIRTQIVHELQSFSLQTDIFEVACLVLGQMIDWLDTLAISHYRAMSRLTLILSNVFLHLYREGYCRPPEADEKQQPAADSKGKLSEGTGVGEGEGEKNVSNEIEFEEQVTGTLNEKEEEDPEKNKEKDDKKDKEDKEENRIDMSQDFDGQLEDLLDEDDQEEKDEDEKNKEKKEEQSEDQEMPKDEMNDNQEQGEEEIQDLDPSWWNSDDEEDEPVEFDNDKDQKQMQDKSSEKDQQKKPEKDKKAAKDSMEANENEPGDQDEDEEGNAQDEDEANSEDENLENARKEESGNEMEEEDGAGNEEENEMEVDQEIDTDKDLDESNDRLQEQNEILPSDSEIEDSLSEVSNAEPEPLKELDDEYTQQPEPEEQMKETEAKEDETNPASETETGQDASNSDQIGATDTNEMDTSSNNNGLDAATNQEIQASSQRSNNSQGVRTLDVKPVQAPSQPQPQSQQQSELPVNEQVERWKQTIHKILQNQPSDSQQPQQDIDMNELTRQQQYQHASDEQQEAAMNVRAEAEESQMTTGQEDDAPTAAKLEMDVDDEASEDAEEETSKDGLAEDVDDEKDSKMKFIPHLKAIEGSAQKSVEDPEMAAHLEKLSLLPSWSSFEQKTSPLAFDLCEQLRLLLTPTQATKLRGDYRTGKRLNLRKILPFIASQYRRDKIWLRRTKPSQRNYRICISIDNSKSMMDTGSVELAFEAIATISQALERLEVGELALIGFGDKASVLQGFSSSVAKITAGEQLRNGVLQFDESSTDFPALLQTVLDTFNDAPSNNQAPTWQLNIILSDGICHHHERINPLLAQCQANRILNIFVLLDNRPAESSIFELSHVEYVNQGIDPITGQVKTAIKMTKYLETFPFEYYVVLRDIHVLPTVLAESIKQWFQMISLHEEEI